MQSSQMWQAAGPKGMPRRINVYPKKSEPASLIPQTSCCRPNLDLGFHRAL